MNIRQGLDSSAFFNYVYLGLFMNNEFSTGCDIEQVDRFTKNIDNNIFLKKIFTQKEIEYCRSKPKPEEHFAARFCAKEAVIKSLTEFDITNIFYKDIEVINEKYGQPIVRILKQIDKNIKIKISLSHSRNNAIATAISYKNS